MTWQVPPTYDWSEETFKNYEAEGRQMFGPYAAIRERLDFDHHGCYSLARQKFQDKIIQDVIGTGLQKAHPWIIFTAGSFFAGKSSVISWMLEEGVLPFSDLVRTDPDLIRTQLPEWQGYLGQDSAEAAVMTHREAGTCSLIAQWESLRCGRHVLVDGSLQNAARQGAFFSEIRAAYPQYRIAIIHVTASWTSTQQRSKMPREGGRVTSPKALRSCYDAVDDSVASLTQLADFVVQVDNDSSPPRLAAAHRGRTGKSSMTWQEVQKQFLQPQRAGYQRLRSVVMLLILFALGRFLCSPCLQLQKAIHLWCR